MKQAGWFVLLGALCFLAQGCATSYKPLTVKNMRAIGSIKVVRTGYPAYLEESPTSHTMEFTGLILFGLLGGVPARAIACSMEMNKGKKLARKYLLPDVNKLIMERFVERVRTDLPDWPKLEVVETPVGKDYKTGPGYVLMIKDGSVDVNSMTFGLTLCATAVMTDPEGKVLWERNYLYKASDFSRNRSLESLEANNCKLLKKQLDFAVNKTVSDFIRHIKGGKLLRENLDQAARRRYIKKRGPNLRAASVEPMKT